MRFKNWASALALVVLSLVPTSAFAQAIPIGGKGTVPLCTHASLHAGTCQQAISGYLATISNGLNGAPNRCAPGAGTGSDQVTCRYKGGIWTEYEPAAVTGLANPLVAPIDAAGYAITNPGNVDGRDVSSDGAKLDDSFIGRWYVNTAAELNTAISECSTFTTTSDAAGEIWVVGPIVEDSTGDTGGSFFLPGVYRNAGLPDVIKGPCALRGFGAEVLGSYVDPRGSQIECIDTATMTASDGAKACVVAQGDGQVIQGVGIITSNNPDAQTVGLLIRAPASDGYVAGQRAIRNPHIETIAVQTETTTNSGRGIVAEFVLGGVIDAYVRGYSTAGIHLQDRDVAGASNNGLKISGRHQTLGDGILIDGNLSCQDVYIDGLISEGSGRGVHLGSGSGCRVHISHSHFEQDKDVAAVPGTEGILNESVNSIVHVTDSFFDNDLANLDYHIRTTQARAAGLPKDTIKGVSFRGNRVPGVTYANMADVVFAQPATATLAGFLSAADKVKIDALDDVINAGVPNGSGSFLDWSEIKNVPAAFADGTDDGSVGGDDLGDHIMTEALKLGAFRLESTGSIVNRIDSDSAGTTDLFDWESATGTLMRLDRNGKLTVGFDGPRNSATLFLNNVEIDGPDDSADAGYTGFATLTIGDTGTPGNIGRLNLFNWIDTHGVSINPAAGAGTFWTWTLPTDNGDANRYMKTDGNGVSSWGQPQFSELGGSATDSQVPDTITASLYLPLAGGSLNGGSALVVPATAAIVSTGGSINATTMLGSGSTTNAVDLATAEVSGTLPIANGGTNATSASAARTSLGLAIGTDVQAFHADLANLVANCVVENDGTPIPDSCVGDGTDGGGGGSLPVVDTTSIAEGSADATKEVRIEVDGLTTGTVRVITMPDANVDLGGLTASNLAAGSLTAADAAADLATQAELDAKSTAAATVDNSLPRFDGTTGDIQPSPSGVTLDDSGNLTIPGTLTAAIIDSPAHATEGGCITFKESLDGTGDNEATLCLTDGEFLGSSTTIADALDNTGRWSGNAIGTAAIGATQLDEASVEAALEALIDLADLQGLLTVAKGGNGTAPGADDQVMVSDSTSAGTFRGLPDSDGATQKLQYDQATNTFSAGTDDDVPESGDLGAVAAETLALTNKTIDAEGTGNVVTIPERLWFPAAGCNNATAAPFLDLPTTGAAAAACVTGTNTQKGVLDFDAAADESGQITHALPADWSGAIDVRFKWLAAATSGDVIWSAQTICVADAETDDPAFNTASTVTDTAKGTTLQTNDAAIAGVTATGCAAGELLHLRISRDADAGGDTMTGDARLVGFELTLRRAM